jgi:universal stress protein A
MPAALRSILCPIDFSDQSRHALRWAEALASRHKSRLIVLTAVDPLLAEAARVRLGLDLATTETEPALREFMRTTLPEESTRRDDAVFQVQIGDPADVIVDTATRENVDLVVMGTHGLGGFRKWLLGSTTERLLRRTTIPVLAIPAVGGESAILNARVAQLTGLVLAATDFSDTSVHAVPWAAQFATEYDVRLLLVHVVEAIAVAPIWESYVQETDAARLAAAGARLEQLAQQLCPRTCDTVVSLGRPGESIALIAEQQNAGLIAMGLGSGSGPLARRPGSIAYQVLSVVNAPVLVVPPEAGVKPAE